MEWQLPSTNSSSVWEESSLKETTPTVIPVPTHHHPLLSLDSTPSPAECDITDIGWSRLDRPTGRTYKSLDLDRGGIREAPKKRQSLQIPLKDEPLPAKTAKAPPPHRCVHTVLPTDTLAGICVQYGCQMADLKRINKLWTNDAFFIRKILYIPVLPPPPPSPELILRHAPSAHPDNLRRLRRERHSTDSEATCVSSASSSASLLADYPRRMSGASNFSTSTTTPGDSPASSATLAASLSPNSPNAKSVEDLLRQIDEDVASVCEALTHLNSLPEVASSLAEESDLNLLSASTARVTLQHASPGTLTSVRPQSQYQYPPPPPPQQPIGATFSFVHGQSLPPSSPSRRPSQDEPRQVPLSPPVAKLRSPGSTPSNPIMSLPPPLPATAVMPPSPPPAPVSQPAPTKKRSLEGMQIVIELTPLLRRLPLPAQLAVAEDVRTRTASSLARGVAAGASAVAVAEDGEVAAATFVASEGVVVKARIADGVGWVGPEGKSAASGKADLIAA
ncbi:hypothetical protein HDU96_001417 [Phlyctochytrium bullatum]|nr:hypothetical protein HDU96_001417 [Phlyctochytrium bullatum]